MKFLFKIILIISLLFYKSGFSQVDKWIQKSEKLSNKKFEKEIRLSKYNLDTNENLSKINKWKSNTSISGENIYNQILNWNKYTTPKKTGIIVKNTIQLDSTSFPFYTYIPKNYSASKRTKLLIYYRGGWISRSHFPENIDKEIVIENPTFNYLDTYNIIEVYPAVKDDLAIYGRYGYEQLRKIVQKTKQQFNIDDNQVYLAGFSDGGRTALNIAYLVPTTFATIFTINGTINSSKVNFANFSNRKMVSFIAENDEIVHNQYPISIAEKANEWDADWTLYFLKDKPHFYTPYQAEVLPTLFKHIQTSGRNPYPNSIIYHKSYDYKEFTNIDWLHIKTDTKRDKENWHHVSKTSIIKAKGDIDTFNYGEKLAQANATYFNNTFDIKTSLVKEIDIYISPLMVNLNLPIKVIINGKEVFNDKINYDKQFIIKEFERNFDRKQVWVNKISLAVE